jgi:hypothetical protein
MSDASHRATQGGDVHEPDIAPLARRLAEENNVDWRRLHGSGEAGRVVERDVLGYLARVMAGEEAVDPTPEPVPDGMGAWPEDDVAAYRARAAHEPPVDSPPTLDDEMFLFDDPEPSDDAPGDDALSPAASTASGTWFGDAQSDPALEDDALLLMGDEAASEPMAPHDADVWAAGEVRFDEVPDVTERDDADAAERAGGHDDPTYGLPDLFATGDEPAADVATGGAEDLLFADEGDEAWTEGASTGADDALSLDADAPADADAPSVDADAPADADVEPDARPPEASWAGEVAHDLGAVDDAPAYGVAPATTDASLRGAASLPSDSGPGVAFVRHGQVWRRRFDDRPLRKAVSEVAAELGASAASVTSVLLARAAVRAGAATGPVDVLRWRAGVAERGTAATNGELRAAIHGLEQGEGVAGGSDVALVVADLSELDLDEAVLHLEAPVLTLGRSVGDGAWLSLSGDEVEGSAIDALARVAALLAVPVRLLV